MKELKEILVSNLVSYPHLLDGETEGQGGKVVVEDLTIQ